MQREVTQPCLACRDGSRGAAHVAEEEQGQERESRKCDGKERYDAGEDFRPRLLWRPGQPRNDVAPPVGQFEQALVACRRLLVEAVQVLQLQRRGDLGEDIGIEPLDTHNDRGSACNDR